MSAICSTEPLKRRSTIPHIPSLKALSARIPQRAPRAQACAGNRGNLTPLFLLHACPISRIWGDNNMPEIVLIAVCEFTLMRWAHHEGEVSCPNCKVYVSHEGSRVASFNELRVGRTIRCRNLSPKHLRP